MTSHLRVEDLSKSFGSSRVLREVSFSVEPGRFLVLLGPSGSGKTTLLRCLAGIERADSGSIHLGDRLLAHGRTHLAPDRRDLAMVFQDYALWPHMSASANVGYALRRRRLAEREARTRLDAVLDRVGMREHAAQYPHELSGGQQQRVALARALVAEPGLLLFDEPLSNLDADLRERLRVEISTLTRESGATVVYITHDQSEAFALADEVGVLEGGRLVQLGSPEDLYLRPSSPFVAQFTGLAGELTGHAAAASTDQSVSVRTGAGVVMAGSGDAVTAGAALRLLIRPAAVTLVDATELAAEAATGSLTGTVVDTAYRGRGYDHVLELPGGAQLTGVFDRLAHRRGTRVHVHLDPEGCFAFPDPQPSPIPAPPHSPEPLSTRTSLEVS